jgi:hypothetical protein
VSVDIPLIDNALVDGPKMFSLLVTNSVVGAIESPLVWIDDNELHGGVDPLFVPDFGCLWCTPYPLSDGRVLVAGGPNGLVMLQTNGWIDTSFARTFAATRQEQLNNLQIYPLHVLAGDRILAEAAQYGGTDAPIRRLIHLTAQGELETICRSPTIRAA